MSVKGVLTHMSGLLYPSILFSEIRNYFSRLKSVDANLISLHASCVYHAASTFVTCHGILLNL